MTYKRCRSKQKLRQEMMNASTCTSVPRRVTGGPASFRTPPSPLSALLWKRFILELDFTL